MLDGLALITRQQRIQLQHRLRKSYNARQYSHCLIVAESCNGAPVFLIGAFFLNKLDAFYSMLS
jgi:hypothetical protein